MTGNEGDVNISNEIDKKKCDRGWTRNKEQSDKLKPLSCNRTTREGPAIAGPSLVATDLLPLPCVLAKRPGLLPDGQSAHGMASN